MKFKVTMKHPNLVEALRTHAHDDMGDVDAEHVHVASIAADEIVRLRDALEFYADPESYFAVMILGDSPCGEIIEDVSDTGEPLGWRHGKRARIALGLEQEDHEPRQRLRNA